MKKYKIKKLPDGKYEVEETLPDQKQVEIVEKFGLEKAIEVLKQDISELQGRLAEKEILLTEINKIP